MASNFIQGLKNLWYGTPDMYYNLVMPSLISGQSSPYNDDYAEKISTVYTCVKVLSDTIATVPLNVYSDKNGSKPVDKTDYRYPILHYNPNAWTNSNVFFASLEYWRNLKGNSFARIYRDSSGKVTSLVLIPPSKVTGYKVQNGELYYNIKEDNDTESVINASEILHFKSLTKDGIWGVNPLEALRYNLSTSYQGHQAINSFYSNNAMSPKALKTTIPNPNQKGLLEGINEFNNKYSGAVNAGKMIVLPVNTEIQDLQLSFADAEFINTLQFNAKQIAAEYRVPAWMVGILESTKFNNVELMMREFKATTLSAIGRMYRQELEFKLLTTQERINGISIEFNWDALFEIDSTSRINNLKTLQGMGVISINDIAKLEGYPIYEGGDIHTMMSNYVTVEQIAKGGSTTPTIDASTGQ